MQAVLTPSQPPMGGIFMSTLQRKKRGAPATSPTSPVKSKSFDAPVPPAKDYKSQSDNELAGGQAPPPPLSPPPPIKQKSLDTGLDTYQFPAPLSPQPRGQFQTNSLEQVPESDIPATYPSSTLGPPSTSPSSSGLGSSSGIFQSTLQRKQRRAAQHPSEASPKSASTSCLLSQTLPRSPAKATGSTTGLDVPSRQARHTPMQLPRLQTTTTASPSTVASASATVASGSRSGWMTPTSPPLSPSSSLMSPPASELGSPSGIFMSTLQRKAKTKCQGPTCMMSRSISTLPRAAPALSPGTGASVQSSFMSAMQPKKPASLFPDSDLESDGEDRVANNPWPVPLDSDEEHPSRSIKAAAVKNSNAAKQLKKQGPTLPKAPAAVSKSWDIPSDSDDDDASPPKPSYSAQRHGRQHLVREPNHSPSRSTVPVMPVEASAVLKTSPPPKRTPPTPPQHDFGRSPTSPTVIPAPPSFQAPSPTGPTVEEDFPPPPPPMSFPSVAEDTIDAPLPPPPATPPHLDNNNDYHKSIVPPPPSSDWAQDSDAEDAPPVPPKSAALPPTEFSAEGGWNLPEDSDDDESSELPRRHSEDSGMLETAVPSSTLPRPKVASAAAGPPKRGALAAATAGRIGSTSGAPEPITMYYNSIKKGKSGGSLIGSDMDMANPADHSSGFDSKSSIISDDDSSYVPSLAEFERSPDATIDVNDLPNSLGQSAPAPAEADQSGKAKRTIVTEETREFVPEESTNDKLVERIVHTQTITEQVAPGTAPVLYKDYGGEDFAKYLEDDDEFVKFIHANGRSEEKKKGRKKGDEPLFIDPFKGMESSKPLKMTTPVEKQTVKQTITTLIRKKKPTGTPQPLQEPVNFHGSESALNLSGRHAAGPMLQPTPAGALNNFTYTDSKIGADSMLSSSDDDHAGGSHMDSPLSFDSLEDVPAGPSGKSKSFWNLEQLGCKQSEACGEVTLGRLRKGKSLDDEGFERKARGKAASGNSSSFDTSTDAADNAAMLFAGTQGSPLKITTLQRQKIPKAAKATGGKSKGFKGFKFWKKGTEKVKVNPLSQTALASSEEGDYQEFVPGAA